MNHEICDYVTTVAATRTHNSERTGLSSIPLELHRAMLQFIHPLDFNYSLALVSRSFRVDIEAQFYKYVAVPEKRLLFFCRTMLARPDLARRVQRLAFTGAVHREPEPGDTDVVAETMRLLVNLKDLSITASNHIRRAEERPWPVHHDDVRILDGCTFRLERLACFFSWAEPLAQWLATQPRLITFEHDGYPQGDVRFPGASAPPAEEDHDGPPQPQLPLLRCTYLRIPPYILACFDGRPKPQPVVLRFDMRFITVRQEFEAARALRDVCRNLKCLTLTRQTCTTEEYLSTSRILRTFADKAPNLTCLALYENIDYVRRRLPPPPFPVQNGLMPAAAVRGGEQADTARHQGALCEAAGVRLGAPELPRHAGRGRLQRVLRVRLLHRVVHRGRGVLVR